MITGIITEIEISYAHHYGRKEWAFI
jgi:hypothetical protein